MAGPLDGRVALVTGGNHGIGAATARALADAGAAVLVTYLSVHDPPDEGTPQTRRSRASGADEVVEQIRAAGGRCEQVEADLRTADVASLFDTAERCFGPVEVLVHNASGWLADTFKPATIDRLGRGLRRVTTDSIDQIFAVDARAGGLLIA